MEVPSAIRKAIANAKKNLITVSTLGTTIPHNSLGRSGAGRVLIMPAPKGTGIIAGGPVRSVLELAGVQDVRAKTIGSNNPKNVVDATLDALANLQTASNIAKLRGKTVKEILGQED